MLNNKSLYTFFLIFSKDLQFYGSLQVSLEIKKRPDSSVARESDRYITHKVYSYGIKILQDYLDHRKSSSSNPYEEANNEIVFQLYLTT